MSNAVTDLDFSLLPALPRPISDFTARRVQDALAGDPLLPPKSVKPRQWLE